MNTTTQTPKPMQLVRDTNKFISKLNKSETLRYPEEIALKQLCRTIEEKLKD